MRGHWMQLAVLVTVLSLVAGCVSAVPAQPSPTQPAPTSVPPTAPPPAATFTSVPPTSTPPPPRPTNPASAQRIPWFNSVWGSSGTDVFVAGYEGEGLSGNQGGRVGRILHYDGSKWSPMSTPATDWLNPIWGSSSSDVFAAGYGGTILHYDGSTWSSRESGTSRTLLGLWGSSGSDVFAVGDSGTILHYDGSKWSPMDSGVESGSYSWLIGVWGSSASDVFAVGDRGIIVHYDGKTWSRMESHSFKDLWGVWGSSGKDVFAVGEPGGAILHFDGNDWSDMKSGTTNDLFTAWGTSSSDVYAVGDSGAMLHYDGKIWSPIDTGTTDNFGSVWGSSSSDIFVTGDDNVQGAILHFDGSKWSPMSIGASAAAPAADPLVVVKAFEEAYNRHDVGATAGLFAGSGCMDWGDSATCGRYGLENTLRYDAALNSGLEISDCSVDGDRVTCIAARHDDCLAASKLGETHYAPVVFGFQDGKIAAMAATRVPAETQRDSMFLYAFLYPLAGWAHQTRPTEWDKAGRQDLLGAADSPIRDARTGAVMSELCKEYAAVSAAATTSNPTPAPPQISSSVRVPSRVLFIGDSSSLQLDDLFPKLAASGRPSMTVASKLNWHGGVPFAGHYELGNALDDIRQGKWDVVVLQDDLNMDWPGRAAEFYEYGRKLDQAIKGTGAETVFYMVYPYKDAKETTTQEIAAAYSKIGQDLGAKVAPVALAFQRSLRERPDLDLYADNEHPNSTGIYLIGCVLYATIFGRSPIGLAYRPGTGYSQISEKDAADLQRIAWETVQDYQAGR